MTLCALVSFETVLEFGRDLELYNTAMAIAPVPIYQERYMSLPELNVEGFTEGSAINFAKQLQGNLLLVHGTADDNCHYQTTEMLIDELIAHNKQFTMFAYPNREQIKTVQLSRQRVWLKRAKK